MTLRKHRYDDGYEIELDGEVILSERDGPKRWPPDEDGVDELFDAAEGRLGESNIDNAQREAHIDVLNILRAAISGQVETVDHRDNSD